MSRLGEIAVRIEPAPRSGGLGPGVAALLAELAGMLDRLALSGETSVVDLRSLPLSAEELTGLQATLGEGEVQADLLAGGPSSIRETGIPGLWWTQHRNFHGDLCAEMLEVCLVPRILERSPDEIQASGRTLRARAAADVA